MKVNHYKKHYSNCTREANREEKIILNLAIALETVIVPKDCFAQLYYSDDSGILFLGVEIVSNETKIVSSREIIGEGESEVEASDNAFANLNNKRCELRKMLEAANKAINSK